MKRFLTLLLVLSILTCFAACGRKPASVTEGEVSSEDVLSSQAAVESIETSHTEQSTISSEASVVESTNASESSTFDAFFWGLVDSHPEDLTSEVMQNAVEEFYAFVNGLQVDNIGKIEVACVSGEWQTESTSDPELIQKWLEVFRSIEISFVERYRREDGGSESFYIYDRDGNLINSFYLSGPYVHFDRYLTKLGIKEMDRNQMRSLMREMNFRPIFAGYDSSSETSQPEQSVLSSNHVVVESTTSSFPLAANSTVSSNSENSQNSVVSHVIPTWEKADPDDVTSEVMQNALEEFHAFIDSLCVENIGKIWVGISDPGGSQSEYATDPELIERWLEMFRSIEIKRVVPYELTYGGHTDFTIYDKEGNIYDGFGFAPSKVRYDDSYLTNLVVEEMDENLLISLLKEMGFKSEYVQGFGYW